MSDGSPTRLPDTQTPQYRTSDRQPLYFFLFILSFFAAWTLYVIVGFPLVRSVGEQTLAYAGINILIRAVLWFLSVIAYVAWVEKQEPFSYLKLAALNRKTLIFTALGMLGYTAIYLIQHGVPTLSASRLTWNSILSTSLSIGLFEETLFRGLILRKLEHYMPFGVANLLTALFFLAIHIPGWLLYVGITHVGLSGMISVVALGFIMGLLTKYSGSLWPAIVTHSFNDFLAAVIWGI